MKPTAAILFLAMLVASAAHAATKETVLYDFSAKLKHGGFTPVGNMVIDPAGNLYGTAIYGETTLECCGVVFELSPAPGGAWSYNVIYTFTGINGDAYPEGPLAIDKAGNLYGTTGVLNNGEVFELSPNGSGVWIETVLYAPTSFIGLNEGVVLDAAGNVYGTAGGGYGPNGFVFELSPGDGGWTFRDIYDFTPNVDPSSVITDGAGNLYGTTATGGSSTNCKDGCGTVFELTNNGGTWSEQVLFDFNGKNGSDPQAVTIDSTGNLYGIAMYGGPNKYGVAFKLVNSSGAWAFKLLHAFSDKNGDGSGPFTTPSLIDGDLFGVTLQGGSSTSCSGSLGEGCGTVFRLTPSGTTWKTTILHSFSGGSDGGFPYGIVWKGNHLYGVAETGGTEYQGYYGGVVYQLSANPTAVQ